MGSFDKIFEGLNKLNERFSAEKPKEEQQKKKEEEQQQKKEQQRKEQQKKEVDDLELLERVSDDERAIDALKAQTGDLGKAIDKVRSSLAKLYVKKDDFDAYKREQVEAMEKLVALVEKVLEVKSDNK